MSARLWACCSPSPLTTKHVSRQYRNSAEVAEISHHNQLGLKTENVGFEPYHTTDWTSAEICRRQIGGPLGDLVFPPDSSTAGTRSNGPVPCDSNHRDTWVQSPRRKRPRVPQIWRPRPWQTFKLLVLLLPPPSAWLLASFRPRHCGRSPNVMKFSTRTISCTVAFNP